MSLSNQVSGNYHVPDWNDDINLNVGADTILVLGLTANLEGIENRVQVRASHDSDVYLYDLTVGTYVLYERATSSQADSSMLNGLDHAYLVWDAVYEGKTYRVKQGYVKVNPAGTVSLPVTPTVVDSESIQELIASFTSDMGSLSEALDEAETHAQSAEDDALTASNAAATAAAAALALTDVELTYESLINSIVPILEQVAIVDINDYFSRTFKVNRYSDVLGGDCAASWKTASATVVSGTYAAGLQADGSYVVDMIDGSQLKLINVSNTLNPIQFGYITDTSSLSTIAMVDSNWAKMKAYISATSYRLSPFPKILSKEEINAKWVAGEDCPIGFYSDSTTDGTDTTGHVTSSGADSPFAVTVTESPNAYPAILESLIDDVNSKTTSVRCYNGGFDGESFRSGFGLKHWYNTWFRAAGSNVDWTDVKYIVIGFGTSDSINQDNQQEVIDNYSADLECVIIDCFLRGVQPALQTPVRTTQHAGSTITYRNANETIVLIEAIQKKLAQKYNLDLFSYSETFEKAINNYITYDFRTFVDADMVHPVDKGHIAHASYLATEFCDRIPVVSDESRVSYLGAGHGAFVPVDASEIISPASRGGTILTSTGIDVAKSWYYEWLDAEGNGKNGEAVMKLYVYVEKPTLLYQQSIDNNRDGTGSITIKSYLHNTTIITKNSSEQRRQPDTRFFSHYSFIGYLDFGLNEIVYSVGTDANNHRLGGAALVPLSMSNCDFGRSSTSGIPRLSKTISYPNVLGNYNLTGGSALPDFAARFYNGEDNYRTDFNFTLNSAANASLTYKIFTHYQSISDYKDSYNVVEILGDNITLKVSSDGTETTVNSGTHTGLTALLSSGARVYIRCTPSHYNGTGVQYQIRVDGTLVYNFTSSTEGELWSDGFGLDITGGLTAIELSSSSMTNVVGALTYNL